LTSANGRPALTLIVAGDPGQRTGGYLYDARIVAVLRDRGWRVDVVGLAGRFPQPDQTARRHMAATLASLPDAALVVIDGLAMGGLPEEVECHAKRLCLVALVHHPLADETGLDPAQQQRLRDSEARALAAARRVIVTSRFTARVLADYGVSDARLRVVEPGVDPSPLASGALGDPPVQRPWRLLCVATLTPRKGLDVLVEALSGLSDRPWHCEVIGSDQRDVAHANALVAHTQRLGLAAQLRFVGERSAEALAKAYSEADLFVLPSYYEGYGMVVTEALSRGLPVITTTGGALADTLPGDAGLAVPPGDAAALREALKRWMDSAELRQRLRRGALRERRALADWTSAGARFAAALATLPEAPLGAVDRPKQRLSG